eukprot:COSAG06_NODE_2335_length_7057_cov_3.119414_7_plen_66_part_00
MGLSSRSARKPLRLSISTTTTICSMGAGSKIVRSKNSVVAPIPVDCLSHRECCVALQMVLVFAPP